MTNQPPVNEPQLTTPSAPATAHRFWWGRGTTVALAALLLVGAGAGAGMAVTGENASPAPTAGPTSTSPPGGGGAVAGNQAGNHAGKPRNGKGRVDPARQAWAHTYGVDRATMANLADVAAASPEQRAAATDLLLRTEA